MLWEGSAVASLPFFIRQKTRQDKKYANLRIPVREMQDDHGENPVL